MKVLIDENLPRKLAGHLKGHECRTVAECGWAGKKNGELLSLAEPQFDVLLTLDKNIPYQQDLKLGRIAILIVRAPSNRIQDLLPVIPDCLVALQSIEPGHVDQFVRLEIWFPIVHQKERNCRIGPHSLVAVDKGVVLANVKQVGGGHGRDGRVKVFTTEGGLRSCKRRLQPSGITDAG